MTGGGTGGHFFPAVALAQGAHERWPDLPIAFVGARRGIEARKLPGGQWPYLMLDVEGLVGRSPVALLRGLWKLWRARNVLVKQWKTQRPRAVIGTGGYGAAPALLAARTLGIPYFLHESNAAPGALVQKLARRATRVWLGMPEASKLLPGAKCLEVGTPVRDAFMRPFKPVDTLLAPHRLLVLGGSGGARPLNDAALEMASGLLDRFPEWEILHQTGASDFERVNAAAKHPRHQVVAFLEDMDQVLEKTSLLISRSGASTCAELIACGRPAILMPFPQAAGDHQRINARAMEAQGRARLVEQGDGLADRLATAAALLMTEAGTRASMSLPEPNQALAKCLDDLSKSLA